MMGFEDFCEEWVRTCRRLDREKPDARRRSSQKGEEFKEHLLQVLSQFTPEGYDILQKRRMEKTDHRFAFLFIKNTTPNLGDIPPSNVIAAVDAKSHGFYSYADIRRMDSVFKTVRRQYPWVRLFYVTFRETQTYDQKVREILADLAKHYYRLSDSGDGVQLPPRQYYPHEWDRLIKDLSSLRTALSK